MPEIHRKVNRYDYAALTELLEAVTGYAPHSIIGGTISILTMPLGGERTRVIRFETITPGRRGNRTQHAYRLAPAMKLEDHQL